MRGFKQFLLRGNVVDLAVGVVIGAAFAGLVGAGRSEAAQAIFGVDPRVSGDITIDGRAVRIKSARDAINSGVYLVPEDRRVSGLIVDDSIRKNISLPDLAAFSSAGLIDTTCTETLSSGMRTFSFSRRVNTSMRGILSSGMPVRRQPGWPSPASLPALYGGLPTPALCLVANYLQ